MRYGMPMIMSETMEIQGCPPFLVKPKKMSKCLGFVTLPKLTQTSPNRGFKKVDSTKNWLCSWVFRSILKQFIIYLVPHHQPLSLVSSIRVNYDSSVTHFLKVFFGIVHPMRPYNSHYSRFRSQWSHSKSQFTHIQSLVCRFPAWISWLSWESSPA